MHLNILLLVAVVAVKSESKEETGLQSPRIRGGHDATKPYPYQVSLQVNATVYGLTDSSNTVNDWAHWCGAAIITNRAILTAGHCLTDFDDAQFPQAYFSVFAGSLKLDGDGVRYFVSKNLTHPKYSMSKGNYDIAIITTSTEIEFITNRVQSIGYSNVATGSGVNCMLTGWGNTGRNGHGLNPLYLQELETPTLSNLECRIRTVAVTETDICTYSRYGQGPGFGRGIEIAISMSESKLRGTITHCFGDSGGPLVDEQKQILVGLVSRAIRCGSGNPDIYTRVSFFYNWIQDYLSS